MKNPIKGDSRKQGEKTEKKEKCLLETEFGTNNHDDSYIIYENLHSLQDRVMLCFNTDTKCIAWSHQIY